MTSKKLSKRVAKPKPRSVPERTAKASTPPLPAALREAILRHDARCSRWILCVSVRDQSMLVFERAGRRRQTGELPDYEFRQRLVVSTSRFGVGQVIHSNRTPLGLHRVARKVGRGQPWGTVFKARQPIGNIRDSMSDGGIVHRILWLDGLEPGLNRGGEVDTFKRYIYIHGFWDETTLGRPQSMGCIHLAAADLLPLFDQVPVGTLVWIAKR
jgi:L,D-transpeptidase catalytic domain